MGAKKALADAAKMSEDYRAQGNTIAALEKLKKTLEGQVHDLSLKLDDAEAAALKGSRKAMSGLKAQYDALSSDYEAEVKNHSNTVKAFRKQERKMKELTFQADEDLLKYRKATNELSASDERAEAAEAALSRMRSANRGAGGSAGGSSGASYSISRKSVFTG